MTSLAESLDSVGERIVDWALVGSPVTDAPVRGWPLARFSTALAIAVAYLAFVVLGSLFARATPGEGVESRAARQSTLRDAAAPPTRRSLLAGPAARSAARA